MRLLIVSHPAVLPVNQTLFARVAAQTGWVVELVVPTRWRSEYGPVAAAKAAHFQGRLTPLPVLLEGNIPLHVYRSRLAKLVGRFAPDAIYVHHEPYALATAQVLRAARRFGGAFGFYSAQNIEKRYPFPISAFERAAYRRAGFAFPVSAAVLDVLRAKGYTGAATVLPLAVDTDVLRPAAASADRPFTVGYVGRLAREKGVDLLIEALRSVTGAHAVIVGDGPAKTELHASARDLGSRIEWRGYVDHESVASAYRGFDVLAVPSRPIPGWSEQFGRVVIEALACGVPVIAADSGELPRLLQETRGGWLFAHGDAGSLAACLGEAVDPHARAERAERGRRHVLERYGISRAAEQFAAGVEAACDRVGRAQGLTAVAAA